MSDDSTIILAAPESAAAPTIRKTDYVSDRAFADFPISTEVLTGLQALGYVMATPVQALTIDPALAGEDLLVRAKTGTGKTAAFCVPVIEKIKAGEHITRALMLCPTRELAIQVSQECAAIAKFKDLRIAAIYGGVGFGPQEDALRDGCEIVVGTPGRVMDHMRRGNLKLEQLQFAVLDEADEMLSMGFLEDVRKILDRASPDRQTFLFSATVNDSVKGLIGRYMKKPEEVFLSYDGDNVSSVTHILYESSPDYHKARALLDLIEQERPGATIIFCNTREDVSTVCTYLERQGLNVEMISGELQQSKREKVMARVKAGATQFLVATDVAARGIDVSDLTHVINYALPDDPAVYLHRIGRTGRIGKSGVAISLAGGADFSTRLTLERTHKIKFDVKALPTPEESQKLRGDRIARTLKDAAGTMAYEGWLEVARALKERPDADTLIAVALRAFFQWDVRRRTEAADAADADGEGQARTDGPREEGRRDRNDRNDRNDRGGRDSRESRDRPPRDRPRDGDRPRDDRGPRAGDRPREDRPPRDGDRAREDRPPREARDGDRPPREARDGDRPPRERRPERRPPPTAPVAAGDEVVPTPAPVGDPAEDEDDGPEGPEGATTEGEAGAPKKRRRRRRRGAKREGVEGAPGEATPGDGGDAPQSAGAAEQGGEDLG